LETYARTGELTGELRVYSRYLTPEQLEQFREGLLISADLDVVMISQFLYTPQGEAILEWLGEVVQTAGRQNGATAIRAAVIKAAVDPDGGLNTLNVLKHFPTQGPRVDLQRLLAIAKVALAEINQTEDAANSIQARAARAASESEQTPALASPGVLAAPGIFAWEKRLFESAPLPTDLYLPQTQNAPLVVLSHGLGSNRATLAYVAEHLASHGFAVVVVEHPGSSTDQLNALLDGRANEAVIPEEMVGRPVAIQELLDALETARARDPDLRDRLNTQQVGVLGQSLGAYTTLALAGATIDLNGLEANCPPQISQLNLSLLLQCLVPTLPQPLPTLQDDRVQAAFAINPLSSEVFGSEGLSNVAVPIMVVAGTSDTVTPALAEQIRPFTWLESPERYLLLMEGGTHFSTIYDPQNVEEAVAVPELAIGPSPELAQRYVKALSLAFFKTHLAGDETYRQYLDPAFAAALSRSELPIALVRELTLGN
ncbi:MAG: alpha/beta hydrolase, partial [Cyanobacteria bacterium J06626_18]